MSRTAKLLDGLQVEAVGHRVVHGGPHYATPQRVTPKLMVELRRLETFDPEHLPAEIALIDSFTSFYPSIPQVACFDTAFHSHMPRVAQLLSVPRRLEAAGVRRYGFHGLSYSYLMEELGRLVGPEVAGGRVILAHLGNGASMAAVHLGQSIDTTMGLTPTAGLPMSTRSGDLDPGLGWFLARTQGTTPEQFFEMVNRESGLLGISETSADMRDLLAKEANDPRAAEAVEFFCYQARKWIGAYTAALGGLDALVFSGGIGENAAEVRARICRDLSYLGIRIDPIRNATDGRVISSDTGPVSVFVIPTDEEVMIAKFTARALADSN